MIWHTRLHNLLWHKRSANAAYERIRNDRLMRPPSMAYGNAIRMLIAFLNMHSGGAEDKRINMDLIILPGAFSWNMITIGNRDTHRANEIYDGK